MQDATTLLKWCETENDHQSADLIVQEIFEYQRQIQLIESKSCYSGIFDHHNCFLEIQPINQDLLDWSLKFTPIYHDWIKSNGFKLSYIEKINHITKAEHIIIKIEGNNAYGHFKAKMGRHIFSIQSCEETVCTLFVSPEIYFDFEPPPDSIKISISPLYSDGLQSNFVTRTEQKVCIKHLPTGIITECSIYRSMHRNRRQAMRLLQAKLWVLNNPTPQTDLNKPVIFYSVNKENKYICDISDAHNPH